MYMDPSLDRVYWDLACDIAVENVITELGLKATTYREAQQAQYIAAIKAELKCVTAEKIYSYLRKTLPDQAKIAQIRGLFYADNHEIWYMTVQEIEETYSVSLSSNGSSSSGETESDQGDEDSKGKDSQESSSDNGESNQSNSTNSPVKNRIFLDATAGAAQARTAMAQVWATISERMQTDIMMFSNGRYGDAGHLIQNLKEVNREKYDYAAFLKKFAVMGEAMKINDEEFDYIFYTYGLQLYKKMPLIEPLEYKEVKRIKEFVIAIDTSGSVIGDLAQTFVQKTYNILKTTESFFTKINLHIIQCDTDIQEHVKITSQEEFDQYIKTMTLKGFGGNNEIALFTYVDNLMKSKEFTNLKGMIYLTDGYGIFPKKKPDYDVAFVFVNDRYEIPEVPPWVIKLILQKDEI